MGEEQRQAVYCWLQRGHVDIGSRKWSHIGIHFPLSTMIIPNGDRIKPQKLSNCRFINRELVLYQNRVHQTCSADSWKMTSPNTTTQENWVSRTLTSSFSIYSPFWVNVQWPSMAYIVPCICIRELWGHCSKLVDWPMIWYQAQQEFQAHGFVSNYRAPQIHCFIILCSSLK